VHSKKKKCENSTEILCKLLNIPATLTVSYNVSILLMKSAAQQAHQVDSSSGAVRKSVECQEAIVAVDGIMHYGHP
jgi:hypothetical protein